MLLSPKKTLFKKSFSGKRIQIKFRNTVKSLKYSSIALLSREIGQVTNFELESLRKFLRRSLKKRGQIFFRCFPQTPITKKPNEVRLGKGKGNIKYWTALVRKNDVILEIKSYGLLNIKDILIKAKSKLSIKTFVYNRSNRWIF